MSPSKLKSNERQAARDRKASGRQAAIAGTVASAYNPSSGTFHTLEPLSVDTGTGHLNGRFKSIDATDDSASSNGVSGDVECMSNSGSYSGESEDQLHTSGKDKNGLEIPGTGGSDKRDKIRGKNERKHQRQKERRAQELRDKCTSYLMSRKLEALAQKLLAMGFSQERATMALFVNDGHVEQSVAWLLEGGEGQLHDDQNVDGNSKVDITEELGQMVEIEKKYNFSRSNIERAVVACEGDLVKALQFLQSRKQSTSPVGNEEHFAQSRSLLNMKEEPSASLPSMLCSAAAIQPKGNAVSQPLQDERSAAICSERRLRVSSVESSVPLDESSKAYAHVREYPNPLTDQQYLVQGSIPSVSVKSTHLSSPFFSTSNIESGLVFGFGTPDPRLISVPSKDHTHNRPMKEPVCTGQMQSRMGSQPIMAPSLCAVSPPAYSPSSWGHGFPEGGSPSSVLHVNLPYREIGWKGTKPPMDSLELGLSGLPLQFNSRVSMQASPGASHWNIPGKGPCSEFQHGLPPNTVARSGSPTESSYGLFTGWGAGVDASSGLFQSSVDWSSGPKPHCDYRNIDWSMNARPSTAQGVSNRLSSLTFQEKSSQQWSLEGEKRFQTGSRAANLSKELLNGHSLWRAAPFGSGMQDNISIESGNAGAHEWTTPFAGKALFSLP